MKTKTKTLQIILFRSLDRCNSWRGESVYRLKPQLCRTDSTRFGHITDSTRFPFPSTPRSTPTTFYERHRKTCPPPLTNSWIEERPDRVDEAAILWDNNK
jgi:hypothetical protein